MNNHPLNELYMMWAAGMALIHDLEPYFLIASGLLFVAIGVAFLLEMFMSVSNAKDE
jgi:hypothetical protein